VHGCRPVLLILQQAEEGGQGRKLEYQYLIPLFALRRDQGVQYPALQTDMRAHCRHALADRAQVTRVGFAPRAGVGVGAGGVFRVGIEAQQVEHLDRRISRHFLTQVLQVAGTGIKTRHVASFAAGLD